MPQDYKNPFENLSGEEIRNSKIKEAGFLEKQFDTGEVKLNYVEGPDNGLSLVLIPAQMGIWESYLKVMVPLSANFHVFVVEIRGHGKSTWTPGDYSWASVGRDMKKFLEEIVREPAIISGNSSGGIIALWCGANIPDLVKAVVLEDAPVFSVELPRFKDKDRFVFEGLKRTVENIGNLENQDLANYFRGQEVPVSEKRSKKAPNWFIEFLSKRIKGYKKKNPGRPIDIYMFPTTLRILIKSLSMFDPDFARAFIDGRFYEGIDHEQALKMLKCPLLVMHADWKRYQKYGLVGAMDDNDAKKIKELVPHSEYIKIPANHVIHMFKPKEFVRAVEKFARTNFKEY